MVLPRFPQLPPAPAAIAAFSPEDVSVGDPAGGTHQALLSEKFLFNHAFNKEDHCPKRSRKGYKAPPPCWHTRTLMLLHSGPTQNAAFEYHSSKC